jgi:hypothetical protein
MPPFPLLQCAADPQRARLEIDIVPLQAQHFALAQPKVSATCHLTALRRLATAAMIARASTTLRASTSRSSARAG